MSSPEELVTAAYHFLADRISFDELYDLALDIDGNLDHPHVGSLPDRLSRRVLLAEGELSAGGRSPSDIRAIVSDVLLADALAHLDAEVPRSG